MNVIEGSGSIVVEPDWTSLLTDELEVAAAAEYWRLITTELRERGLLAPVNGHSIQRLSRPCRPAICTAAESAHAAFAVVAASGSVSDRTIQREAQAYAVLQPLCVDPASQTSASILVAAAGAYATLTLALREAEQGE